MDTIHRVEAYCRDEKYELIGIGIPKTVDNDLFGTDHTPGFASAARSNILNVMQGGLLARDMQKVDKFLKEAESCIKLNGWVSIVCGEGLKYADGTPVSSATTKDKFNNTEFGAMGGASVALSLHRIMTDEFGCRGEFQITESLIMSDFVRSSTVDLEEAYRCGVEAVRLAEKDKSGVMVSIKRVSNDPYLIEFGTVPLHEVAVSAKPMPLDYFNSEGNHVSSLFIDYMKPLAGELPKFIRLEESFRKMN